MEAMVHTVEGKRIVSLVFEKYEHDECSTFVRACGANWTMARAVQKSNEMSEQEARVVAHVFSEIFSKLRKVE